MSSYVCWDCRYRPSHPNGPCPKCGKEMHYVHHGIPANRDDHKMWQLARAKFFEPRRGRPRRRVRRPSPLAQWEKELLKAAR